MTPWICFYSEDAFRRAAYALVERDVLGPKLGLGEPTAMVTALSKLDARPTGDGSGLSVCISTREPRNHYGRTLLEAVSSFLQWHSE